MTAPELRAECDARGTDYPDDAPTDPGAYRPARPARPAVSRWRPTRYVSCDDGATWLRHTVRAWTYQPTRVRGRRALAHIAARDAAAARGEALAETLAYVLATVGAFVGLALSFLYMPL